MITRLTYNGKCIGYAADGWQLPILGGPSLDQIKEIQRRINAQMAAPAPAPVAPVQKTVVESWTLGRRHWLRNTCSSCGGVVPAKSTLLVEDEGGRALRVYQCPHCAKYLAWS